MRYWRLATSVRWKRPAISEIKTGVNLMQLIVTGGGTGGHTYPALTTVAALRSLLAARGQALEVLWIGQADSLESRVAAENGIPFAAVVVGKIRRDANPLKMMSPQNAKDMANVPRGVVQARGHLKAFHPEAVLATGGYAAFPAGMAAKLMKVPLVVHEQTVHLGLVNRVLAKVATTVAVTSPSTIPLLPEEARDRAVVTGNPVRPELFGGQAIRAVETLELDSFDPRLPTVYITGGAAGAVQINDLTAALLPWLLERANVIHQCGPNNAESVGDAARALPPHLAARYRWKPYLGAELSDVLALADVVVSRSGAGTMAELTALGKPAVLIPYAAAASGEQDKGARYLAEQGAAVALLDEVGPPQLAEALDRLLGDSGFRAAVADRAKALGRPDAGEHLASVVLAAASG